MDDLEGIFEREFDENGLPPESVLSPVQDNMLIRGLYKYAEEAGLSGHHHYIWESVKDKPYLTEDDLDLAQELPNLKLSLDKAGMFYTETGKTNNVVISSKFMALTGLMVRNYISALYIPMNELMGLLMENAIPEAKILFVPDFVISNDVKRGQKEESVHGWKKELINYLLLKREAENKQTVLYVKDLNLVEQRYGRDIARYIAEKYLHANMGEE